LWAADLVFTTSLLRSNLLHNIQDNHSHFKIIGCFCTSDYFVLYFVLFIKITMQALVREQLRVYSELAKGGSSKAGESKLKKP
jgi:hypothetical protein